MENIEQLLKTSLNEIEKMVTTKTVVGEPIVVADTTIIPLISVGVGFGGGGGGGKAKPEQEGSGSGIGGGVGIKPIAVIIIDKNGARVESLKGRLGEGLGSLIHQVMEKYAEKKPAA